MDTKTLFWSKNVFVERVLLVKRFSVFFYIFRRFHSKQIAELLPEVFNVVNANLIRSFHNSRIAADEYFSGTPQSDKPYKSVCRLP